MILKIHKGRKLVEGLREGGMGSLQGPVICPTIRSKQVGIYTLPVNGRIMKARIPSSALWGNKGIGGTINGGAPSHQLQVRKCKTPQCSFSSSSNGSDSMAENFNENDGDYVNSSVVEADAPIFDNM